MANDSLYPSNVFQSFIRPLYNIMDRSKLYKPSSFTGSLADKYPIYYGSLSPGAREKLKDCFGFFYPSLGRFQGGRGKASSPFNVRVFASFDADIYNQVTIPMVDEILRIYEVEYLPLYDSADPDNPTQSTAGFIIPIMESVDFDDDIIGDLGFRISTVNFMVVNNRCNAKHEIPKA